MNRAELERILGVVRQHTREAGALVSHGYRKRPSVEHKSALELVTRFDRESEALLRAKLSASFAFDVVGEEHGGASTKAAPTFFVDPIDGTTNFVHGHPFWCVSVGLAVGGEPILGVVLAPSLGQEWYGYVSYTGERLARRRSWGLTLDGREVDEPIHVSATPTLQEALLATGFPYDRRTSSDNNFDAFVAIKLRSQAVRRCGSAALDLCLVADGTYEGYWERKLKPWDMAGGAAIVRAAGGRVSDFEGGAASMESGRIVATNGAIHAALLQEIANAPRLAPAPPT